MKKIYLTPAVETLEINPMGVLMESNTDPTSELHWMPARKNDVFLINN